MFPRATVPKTTPTDLCGGIANFHEQDGGKSFRQMREDIRRSQELQERKNSKKRRPKTQVQREATLVQEIRDLKNRKFVAGLNNSITLFL